MGCTVLIHNKLDIRKAWDAHANGGFYIETSLERYQCYEVWVKETQSVCIADMVFFKHKYITMPTVRKADAIVTVMKHLAQVIRTK